MHPYFAKILAALALAVIAAASAAPAGRGLPAPRLAHSVWLGPGCDQIVEMDDFYEMVGALIVESGVRLAERGDKLELECFGTISRGGMGYKAYANARVTITRSVDYRGQQGRMLLNRATYAVEMEAVTRPGLRDPFRKALRSTMREALGAYGRGRYAELMPRS